MTALLTFLLGLFAFAAPVALVLGLGRVIARRLRTADQQGCAFALVFLLAAIGAVPVDLELDGIDSDLDATVRREELEGPLLLFP